MREYQHFILTRFNLKSKSWSKDKNKNPTGNDEWMNHRIKIFERYCFPSIKNQTNQKFLWLVFFSENTKEKYKKIIERLQKVYSNFVPIYLSVEKGNNLNNYLNNNQLIENLLNKNTKYVITTRIDNDDCLGKYAVETIQEYANKIIPKLNRKRIFVNLLLGYIFDKKSKKLYLTEEFSNPFISLIEEITDDSIKTVWGAKHNEVSKLGKIKQIYDKPNWLRIIHEKNVLNEIGSGPGVKEEISLTKIDKGFKNLI